MIGQDGARDSPFGVHTQVWVPSCTNSLGRLRPGSDAAHIPQRLVGMKWMSAERHFEASGQSSPALCSRHQNPGSRSPQKARKQKVRCNARKAPLCRNRLTSLAQTVFDLRQTQVSAWCFPPSHCKTHRTTPAWPYTSPRQCGLPEHRPGMLLQPFPLSLAASRGN